MFRWMSTQPGKNYICACPGDHDYEWSKAVLLVAYMPANYKHRSECRQGDFKYQELIHKANVTIFKQKQGSQLKFRS